MKLHPLIQHELDTLAIGFPGRSHINASEFAQLFNVRNVKDVPRYACRWGIPYVKAGSARLFSVIDLATYNAQCKVGAGSAVVLNTQDYAEKMNSRRGFNQMAEKKQLQNSSRRVG